MLFVYSLFKSLIRSLIIVVGYITKFRNTPKTKEIQTGVMLSDKPHHHVKVITQRWGGIHQYAPEDLVPPVVTTYGSYGFISRVRLQTNKT